MTTCPDCGFENIDGVDACEQCEQPLTPLSIRPASSRVEAALLEDSIEVLSPVEPLFAPPDAELGDVLNTLVKNDIGCVLVVDGDQLVGIFSERDALMRLNTEFGELTHLPVSQFMTPNPATLESHNKIAFALHRMHIGGFRHVPIMKDGRIHGIISVRDILRYLADRLVVAEAS